MTEGYTRMRVKRSKTSLKTSLFIAVAILATAALMLFALAGPARAAKFGVTNTNDSGTGSLRQAITAANANAGADTIEITATGTLRLQSALPEITTDMDIAGPGAKSFTVRRNTDGEYRIFTVGSGATVKISGLTATNGLVVGDRGADSSSSDSEAGGAISGGGVSNAGTLTLMNSVVSGNAARGGNGGNGGNASFGFGGPGGNGSGGGVSNTGSLTLTNTTVSGNTAEGGTGGSAFSIGFGGRGGNGSGGGVSNTGNLTLTNTTVSGNTARGSNGGDGGVASIGGNGSGGGVSNTGNLTLTNTTVSGNIVERGTGGSSGGPEGRTSGGGVVTEGGSATLTSATITNNRAAQGANLRASATTTIGNTIISNPQGGGVSCSFDDAASSNGYNLEDADTCNFNQTTDQPNTDPLLGPLADDGGPTMTHAIPQNSPAVDKGNTTLATDQRGESRPSDFPNVPNATGGNGSDIGAFERQVPRPNPLGCTIVGTPGNDRLVGTSGRDVICGLGGNDAIYGLGGSDVIYGGPGNDVIYGGAGNDRLIGGPGRDRLFGQTGRDILNARDGVRGNDVANGGPGRDRCFADPRDVKRNCP